jgi:hypothetical protein
MPSRSASQTGSPWAMWRASASFLIRVALGRSTVPPTRAEYSSSATASARATSMSTGRARRMVRAPGRAGAAPPVRMANVDSGTRPWSSSALAAATSRDGHVTRHEESGPGERLAITLRHWSRSSGIPAEPMSGCSSHTCRADHRLDIASGCRRVGTTTPATRAPEGRAAVTTSPSGGFSAAGSIGSSDANHAVWASIRPAENDDAFTPPAGSRR